MYADDYMILKYILNLKYNVCIHVCTVIIYTVQYVGKQRYVKVHVHAYIEISTCTCSFTLQPSPILVVIKVDPIDCSAIL